MPINENDVMMPNDRLPLSDAPGHAALLLVESLIHGLCERGVLSAEQAIEIVERAAEVQSDLAEEADGKSASLWKSQALLSKIAASLRTDCDNGPVLPNLTP